VGVGAAWAVALVLLYSRGMGARRHTDLQVWILANELRERTHDIIRTGRLAQHLWLREQLGRASHSACANIAEGFGRYQPRDFARFLRIAKGSLLEVDEHLRMAGTLGLVAEGEIVQLSQLVHRAVAGIARLIRYLEAARAP
jgi:four helix bundle protein